MTSEENSQPSKSLLDHLHDWGTNSLPPALLATLVTALHGRPMQALPLFLFTPPLLFSSYLNLSGYPTGSAGLTAAWSGLYALLALRRRQSLKGKFSIRGIVRGTAVGLGTANAVAGGWVYFTGDLTKDAEERKKRNRWGNKD
ncbi:Fc.00g008730.m01.CDS01 [Cosmosporella sp. VM-42]